MEHLKLVVIYGLGCVKSMLDDQRLNERATTMINLSHLLDSSEIDFAKFPDLVVVRIVEIRCAYIIGRFFDLFQSCLKS